MKSQTVISQDGHEVQVTARRIKSEFATMAYWYPVLNGWTNRARPFSTKTEAIEEAKSSAQE